MQTMHARIAALRWIRTSGQRGAHRPADSSHFHTAGHRSGAVTTLWLAFALIWPLQATSGDSEALDLRSALERAISQNLEFAASTHRLAETSGLLRQADLLPNPEVGIDAENFGGQGGFRGYDNAETTISLGWLIEPGSRGGRVDVARAQSGRVQLESQILRMDLAAETAQRFLTALQSQEHLATTQNAVELGERMVTAVERQTKVGRATTAELARARAELASLRLAREDVSHERAVAYHRLAAQWGETSPSFSHVVGSLLDLPAAVSFETLLASIEDNPGLARLLSEQRIADAQLKLAKASRWPRLTPSLGARKFETGDNWAVVAGMKLELPVFDRNQGAVAASRAAAARTRADAEAMRVRTRTTLYAFHEELEHSVHRARVLRDEVIPRFEEATTETQRAYERGRIPYHELRAVQMELLAAKHDLVEASTSAHRIVITLERLLGERIVR